MKQFCYQTQIGKIYISENSGKICGVSFRKGFECENVETELIKKTYRQICEYLNGERKVFDIPIEICGTEFQSRVWKALLEIPYGKTVTYKDIAKNIGQPSASRAVGMANNKNKIAIIIPCHRVIGQNGQLTGYAGGLDIKRYLLDLERINCNK